MNKQRRASLQKIADRFRELCKELAILKGEEEAYRDNMPESFQDSERYEKAEEAVSCLDEAVASIESAADEIESAIAV